MMMFSARKTHGFSEIFILINKYLHDVINISKAGNINTAIFFGHKENKNDMHKYKPYTSY